MAYLCKVPTSETIGTDYVDDGQGNNKGECVSLVKRMALPPGMPPTSAWKAGEKVKDNKTILEGTAIASFDPKTGRLWHAAIYVKQDVVGIWVWDQYCRGATAHPPQLNQLKWENKSHPHVAGDNFYIIEHK